MPYALKGKKMLKEIQEAKFKLSDKGRSEAVEKQHSMNKLTARERISILCDLGTFIEYGMLATPPEAETEAMRGLEVPSDGLITGIGKVNGQTVAVASSDFTVLGGSMGTVGGEKWHRCLSLALQYGFPAIYLHDGGGHRIQEGLDARHFASGGVRDLFNIQAKMSGWAIMVSAMMGPGFAGPSNVAAMCDFVPMVKGTSTMGIAGPEIVKGALGEDITKEELGGSRFHTEVTGMADLEVDSDQACIDIIKKFLSYFPANASMKPAIVKTDDPWDRREEALLTIVPESPSKQYDMRKVIQSIFDLGSIFELKPTFAKNILTILARLNGRSVGIVANQPSFLAGVIDTKAVDKAARFISLCDAFNIPLIFLIDIPGFLPGSTSERSGLVRHSGKLLYEIGHSTVTKISVVIRKGYGLGYFAMCGGRTFNADYCVGWPSSEYCAMGIEGSVNIAYRREIASAPDPIKKRNELIDYFRTRIKSLAGAQGFGVDDIIDPRDTRPALIQILESLPEKKHEFMPPKKHGIVPI
jgi:acetyl-CoA carboxylase carboxyltransferase component